MVLVDTSIWIRFLAGAKPYAGELDRLLSNDEVLGHDFVYGELLIGDRGARTKLLAEYKLMRQATLVAHQVVEFVRHHKINGLGIGWIETLLMYDSRRAGFSWPSPAAPSRALENPPMSS